MAYTVGYLSADCVVIFEMHSGSYAVLYFFDYLIEAFERLRCLRVECYVAVEIDFVKPREVFYHDGIALGLPYKTVDLGMTVLAIDDNLGAVAVGVVFSFYPLLQFEHYRASGVDNLNAHLVGYSVGRRRFAMGAE